MVAFKVIDTRDIVIVLFISVFLASTYALNLDHIGRQKQNNDISSNNKKITPNAPVLLNIRHNFYRTPKLLSKLMHIKLAETKLNFQRTVPPIASTTSKKLPAKRYRRAIAIPQLPMVPFIVPLIPRILPFLPSALAPSLRQRFPHIKKNDKSNLVKKKELSSKDKRVILAKLREMKAKGALSYPDYYRFRKLLW